MALQRAQLLGGVPELARVVPGAVVVARGAKDGEASVRLAVHSSLLPPFGVLELGVEAVDDIEFVGEREDAASEGSATGNAELAVKHATHEHRCLDGRREQGCLRGRVSAQRHEVFPARLLHLGIAGHHDGHVPGVCSNQLGEEPRRVGKRGRQPDHMARTRHLAAPSPNEMSHLRAVGPGVGMDLVEQDEVRRAARISNEQSAHAGFSEQPVHHLRRREEDLGRFGGQRPAGEHERVQLMAALAAPKETAFLVFVRPDVIAGTSVFHTGDDR